MNKVNASKKAKKGDGKSKLDLGDLLGRSKEGFQRLKTDDVDDDEENSISSESDDEEEFSLPAMRA